MRLLGLTSTLLLNQVIDNLQCRFMATRHGSRNPVLAIHKHSRCAGNTRTPNLGLSLLHFGINTEAVVIFEEFFAVDTVPGHEISKSFTRIQRRSPASASNRAS